MSSIKCIPVFNINVIYYIVSFKNVFLKVGF